MALDQSDVSALLDALRAGDGVDLIRDLVRFVLQELVETEACAVIGAGHLWDEPVVLGTLDLAVCEELADGRRDPRRCLRLASLLAYDHVLPFVKKTVGPDHLLVTPKRHAPYLADLSGDEASAMFQLGTRLESRQSPLTLSQQLGPSRSPAVSPFHEASRSCRFISETRTHGEVWFDSS